MKENTLGGMLGQRDMMDVINQPDKSDPRYADAKELKVGDTIGRVDPERINEELFKELGMWDEDAKKVFSGMDDEEYDIREEAAAMGLSHKYELEMKNRMSEETDPDKIVLKKNELTQEYRNKLQKYNSIFGRATNKLVGRAFKQANDMYGAE